MPPFCTYNLHEERGLISEAWVLSRILETPMSAIRSKADNRAFRRPLPQMPSFETLPPSCALSAVDVVSRRGCRPRLYSALSALPLNHSSNQIGETMNRRHILSISAITAVGLAILPGSAFAQT